MMMMMIMDHTLNSLNLKYIPMALRDILKDAKKGLQREMQGINFVMKASEGEYQE